MFDMQIITNGPEYTFMPINKKEHELIDAYLKDKKLWVKNEVVPDGDLLLAMAGDDLDKEMLSIASDNDEELCVRWTGNDNNNSKDGKTSPLPPPPN